MSLLEDTLQGFRSLIIIIKFINLSSLHSWGRKPLCYWRIYLTVRIWELNPQTCVYLNEAYSYSVWLHSSWPIWIWIYWSKIRFFIPFHHNPIFDCNPNDPPPEADHSDWYLKLFLECYSFHLINWFINHIIDCLITWTTDQKSQGNLDPGTSVWKQIRFWILCPSWSAI